MKNTNVKPVLSPARDAVVLRVIGARMDRRGAVTLTLEPEQIQVIDFYSLKPSQQQRSRNGR